MVFGCSQLTVMVAGAVAFSLCLWYRPQGRGVDQPDAKRKLQETIKDAERRLLDSITETEVKAAGLHPGVVKRAQSDDLQVIDIGARRPGRSRGPLNRSQKSWQRRLERDKLSTRLLPVPV